MYICQICKKSPATIHLTDIHNNIKKEVHLCESCAAEKGFNLQGAANLPQLLGLAAKKGIVSAAGGTQGVAKPAAKSAEDDLICLKCGSTWSQFSDRGRLGCPHDYHVFDRRLRALVTSQIAPMADTGGKLHVGKTPGTPARPGAREQTIRSLEKKLRRAVAEENYESAARLKAELDDLRAAAREGDTA